MLVGESCTTADKVHKIITDAKCIDNIIQCRDKYYEVNSYTCAKGKCVGIRINVRTKCLSVYIKTKKLTE